MMLGDKLHTKNNKNTCYLVESRQTTFYTHVLKVFVNFQPLKKLRKKITKINDIIPLIRINGHVNIVTCSLILINKIYCQDNMPEIQKASRRYKTTKLHMIDLRLYDNFMSYVP